MLPEAVLYCGSEELVSDGIELRAGSLSMILEPTEGFLRHIRMGDQEILRGIYVAVRDRNWGTVPSIISNLNVEKSDSAFHLTFEAECSEREVRFFWNGSITGDRHGNITFIMEGHALSTFLSNRVGFCVLHPIRECAGRPCVVEKVNGVTERGIFPYYISAHQPFTDMRAISHEVVPGLLAEVRFEGDVFEMEDQRNWTDASFKTYCTPLRLPFPVEITEGADIRQSVTLTLKGGTQASSPRVGANASEVVFTVDEATAVALPPLGLGTIAYGRLLNETERQRLKTLKLSHLRADLNLSEPNYKKNLARAAAEAASLGTALEVALFLTNDAENELGDLVKVLERVKPRVSTWLIFHTQEKSTSKQWVRLARDYLLNYDVEAKIGAGTNAYFAELNRGRPPAEEVDLVCYSISPQVHASDEVSLVETLQAQAWSVESARRVSGGRPISVTPVTLKPRFNPNATGREPEPRPGELHSQVDVRQMSLFGAGWTLGSIKYLAESGVHSATYYETTGWRGVMETENGSPLPEKFRSIAGAVFPLYHVLADVGGFVGGHVVVCNSSAPLRVDGMALHKGIQTRVLLANLSPRSQDVQLAYPGFSEHVQVKHLDESNVREAMRSPESFRADPGLLLQTSGGQLQLHLLPYSFTRIDPAETDHG